MAMQTGLSLSKLILVIGAGYTGTIVVRNGKMSDILMDLQSLLKTSGSETSRGDRDAIASQINKLMMEVRQMGSSKSITVLNGNSGQVGDVSFLVLPAICLGALGYGYMWWKGLSFSDLMYVTKRNMQNAVSNMTKHLDQVSAALAATKKHLTQRIENLDGKLDEQKEMSKLIKNEVMEVHTDLSQIGYDIDQLQSLISGLDFKIGTLEDKQDFANAGVWYLCQFVSEKSGKLPELIKDFPKPKRNFLENMEAASPKGLLHLFESENSGSVTPSATRSLTRMTSIKC